MTSSAYFETKRSEIQARIEVAGDIKKLNDDLARFNWMFIHPEIFMTEYNRLTKLAADPQVDQAAVTRVFADLFYDFRITALTIDGNFKKNPYIGLFGFVIDQAVMLAITHDYAGAIHILIPVIEGSIRQYLISKTGKRHDQIMKSEHLLQAFNFIGEDYVSHRKATHQEKCAAGEIDINQLKRLVVLERQYITIWLSMIHEYFEHNLFLNTTGTIVPDSLNRHVLVHGFTAEVEHSLSNFLKVYNTLVYISWAFREGNPAIPSFTQLKNEDILYKWKAFEKLNMVNVVTDSIKISVYEKYPDFSNADFKFVPSQPRFKPADPANIKSNFEAVDALIKELYPLRP